MIFFNTVREETIVLLLYGGGRIAWRLPTVDVRSGPTGWDRPSGDQRVRCN